MTRSPTRPRPTAPPVYTRGSDKVGEAEARTWGVDDVADALFFAVSALLTLWLAWVLLGSGWHLQPRAVVFSLLFWAVLAYLALPRLHQVLTWLYVPDYFIGRTRTPDGLLGDPVNLAVQGYEEDIHEAMTAAGWVRADPISLRSSWGIVVSSVLRRSYPAAPVSTLQLFGRGQDFAYQKEVAGNPAQRHHIRFWHTPDAWVLPGGRRVDWLAAATYDRSVGLSALTLQVTHKIDADIDVERNYVVDDVLWANPAATLEIWNDFFTSYHDKNGGGDRVVTDGDLYVLDVHEVVPGPQEDLLRARRADVAAGRRRPAALVISLVLLGLLTVVNAVEAFRGDVLRTMALDPEIAAEPYGTEIPYGIVAATTTIAALAIAGLGVAVWHGHPRSRIVLMGVLTVSVLTDMSQVAALGVRQTTIRLVVSSALGVLALLAISARPCHQWERARKEERAARRAQPHAEHADRPAAEDKTATRC
ncbi:MAG: LssY C-terminal domain-containing protein [Actinomyces sp.]|uniref:LssY C-terminal domain-containing protein n=1 Tax=Actinomyces sp. TaxID=29317 RepID=UPI0026DA7B89|nr:LssY C-terminal domain-containing protein [Actinomyces sp.]MDO4243619.1 LssY C-terminal domain-containing protein [Actinomyces sp.]